MFDRLREFFGRPQGWANFEARNTCYAELATRLRLAGIDAKVSGYPDDALILNDLATSLDIAGASASGGSARKTLRERRELERREPPGLPPS